MQRALLTLALALALAAPASAHLLQRGVPLSELAASSPLAVVGRVVGADGDAVALEVEQSVLGAAPAGELRFALLGHHPPRYAPGSRVLIFLTTAAPPWASRQTALDRLELPEAAAERAALLQAVRDYAALREVKDRDARLARLKQLALSHLESPSPRVRHDALLDLVALAPRLRFEPEELAGLARLAGRPDTPATLAPGLVVLLATIRQPGAEEGLHAVLRSDGDAQARASAARVLARRHGAAAATALRRALKDPAPAVSATARHELARLELTATAAPHSANPPEGMDHVQADRN